ncbi:hypothetical protein PVAP13_5KG230921 [Panicum virgatum]|uniref:Uncharacterized protein n=1 Tax=Panicum virgatum TaxID=38727 RepID=A0A8T0SK23_PANVG|nr:hypothetical protein PVAP13_5KG230921 [Panicum virgatum]
MMRDLLRITLWRQQKERKLPDMSPSSYPPPTGTYDEYVPK